MAKCKKVQDKLRLYYRGPIKKPTKVANEDEMKTISKAIEECAPKRFNSVFNIKWTHQEFIPVKIVIGLAAGLRHLKRKETIALLFDDTASEHLANLLIDFAQKQNIPIVKAKGLLGLAPKVKLNTLLVFSLVRASNLLSEVNCEKLEIESLQQLADLLQGVLPSDTNDKGLFRAAQLDLVRSSGRSKAKKTDKRTARAKLSKKT